MTGILPKVFTGAPPGNTVKQESEPGKQKILIPNPNPIDGPLLLAVLENAASVALSANPGVGFFAVLPGPRGNGKTIQIQKTAGPMVLIQDNGTNVIIDIGSTTPTPDQVNALAGLKTLNAFNTTTTQAMLTLLEGPLTLAGGKESKKTPFVESQVEPAASIKAYPTPTTGVGKPKRKFDTLGPSVT